MVLAAFTRMSLIVRAISEHKARTIERLGVPPWVAATTYALRRRGRPYRAGPTELARELGITQSAMTARTRRLAADGLVTTGRDPDDGRRVLMTLTAKGRRLTERIVRLQAGVEDHLMTALTAKERGDLDRVLRRLFGAFEGYSARSGLDTR